MQIVAKLQKKRNNVVMIQRCQSRCQFQVVKQERASEHAVGSEERFLK